MTAHDAIWQALISLLVLACGFGMVYYGWPWGHARLLRWEERCDRTLNQQLMLDIHPRTMLAVFVLAIVILGMVGYLLGESWVWASAAAAIGLFLPPLVLRQLETRRRRRLESQLVDGIMTLASGVRAGLTLVQAMELVVTNGAGPIKQEFAQLLREYQMGRDLHQAMRQAANRIGSSHYRLLFTALEMHRQRGGDMGQSLDRIAESVREIQRLEGKLDALTAQGRTQARMMAGMAVVVLLIYYVIDPEGVTLLFVEPMGRVLLLGAGLLVVIGFLWIRRIMAVDI